MNELGNATKAEENRAAVSLEPRLSKEEMVSLLKSDVAAWNKYRITMDTLPDMTRANLNGANLTRAILHGANLTRAGLNGANLTRANLNGAELIRANLNDADLTRAELNGANLNGANLNGANLNGAELNSAELNSANLNGANLENTNVRDVQYKRKELHGKCLGIRASSCYGDAIFRRDVQDQDYIDNVKRRWATTPWRKALFHAWGVFDYGRSVHAVLLMGVGIIAAFGLLYHLFPGWLSSNVPDRPTTWFTPWYYSVVTFVTLGFGDISAKGLAGEVCVVAEVLLGYVTLGLLLSVLANVFARRS